MAGERWDYGVDPGALRCDTPELAARAVMGEIRAASVPDHRQMFHDHRGWKVQHYGRWLWLADPAYVAALPTGEPR